MSYAVALRSGYMWRYAKDLALHEIPLFKPDAPVQFLSLDRQTAMAWIRPGRRRLLIGKVVPFLAGWEWLYFKNDSMAMYSAAPLASAEINDSVGYF